MSLGNVLVIRPGALGDAVLTLPALRALYDAGADSVTVLGIPSSWAFLHPSQCPVRIADFSSSTWLGLFADGATLSTQARAILENTQTAVVYLNDDTNGIQQCLMRCGVSNVLVIDPPVATPFHMTLNTAQNFDCFDPERTDDHAARQLLDPLSHIIADANAADILPFAMRADFSNWLGAVQASDATSFAIHPGSGGQKKCWPAGQFAELAAHVSEKTGLKALVFFGPADDEFRNEFSAAIRLGTNWEAVENRPLRDVMARLCSCRFYVGNDSGLSHVAARIIPVLSIFGPTDPGTWAPLGERVRIVQAPGGNLNALDADTVLEVLEPWVAGPGSASLT
ncbi:MAG: glycosyltransferase family 9 protein [Planctomycetota bacterium]